MSIFSERDGQFVGLEAVSQVLSEDNEKKGFISEINKRHGQNLHKLKERSDFLAEFMRNNDISLDENPSVHSDISVGDNFNNGEGGTGTNLNHPRSFNKSNFKGIDDFNPSFEEFTNRLDHSMPVSSEGFQPSDTKTMDQQNSQSKLTNGKSIIQSIDNLFENMRNKYNLSLIGQDQSSQLIESTALHLDKSESQTPVEKSIGLEYDSNVESILARVRTTRAQNKGGDQNNRQQFEATLRQEKEFEKRKEDIQKKFGIAMTNQGQRFQLNEDERKVDNQIINIRSKAKNGQRDTSATNSRTELSPVSEKEKPIRSARKNTLFKDISSSSSNSSENESSLKKGKNKKLTIKMSSKTKEGDCKRQKDKYCDELDQITQNKPNFKDNFKKLKQLYNKNFNKAVNPPQVESEVNEEPINSQPKFSQEQNSQSDNKHINQFHPQQVQPIKDQKQSISYQRLNSPNMRSPSPILKQSTPGTKNIIYRQGEGNFLAVNDTNRGRSPFNQSDFDKSDDFNTYSFEDVEIPVNNESDVFNISPDHSTRLGHHMISLDDRNLSAFHENQSLQASFLDSSLLHPPMHRTSASFTNSSQGRHSQNDPILIPQQNHRIISSKQSNIIETSLVSAHTTLGVLRNESELNYSQSQQDESQVFQFKTGDPKNQQHSDISPNILFTTDPVLIRLELEKEELLQELKYWEDQLEEIDNEAEAEVF